MMAAANSVESRRTHDSMASQGFRWRRFTFILSTAVLLAACSGGGSGDGGSDRDSDASNPPVSNGFVYDGPAPVNAEIQSFKLNFYDNLVADNRCGLCHTPGGSGGVHFVNRDDVNAAWQSAKEVVDLLAPAKSEVVQRVVQGHNCWIAGGESSCGVTIESYVEKWASALSQSTNAILLTPRTFYNPSASQKLPDSYNDVTELSGNQLNLSDSDELIGLLVEYCAGCHSDASPQAQTPFFASGNVDIAYEALRGKIDLSHPEQSRIIVRLIEERHNCGSDCSVIASELVEAIERFSLLVPEESIDREVTQISAAQQLIRDGIVASAGGRYEADVIAKWEFREGQGTTVADTSGVAPAMVLSVVGDHEWMSGWGMRFNGGRVQSSVSASKKLENLLSATGEYTIEMWIAPFNVSQEDAWITGYSGSSTSSNLVLSQTLYNYDVATRSSVIADNSGGLPLTSTDADAEFAQATLQHVVATFDPVAGRQIFVNGVNTEAEDVTGGGLLNNWNDGFALTLANSVAGTNSWKGAIRLAAIHNRKLSPEQIAVNFEAGVGQKYYQLFSLSELLDDAGNCHSGSGENRIDYCYIVFEVSEYDDASYLFARPAFVNINPNPSPLNFRLQGLRLGINGKLSLVGQSFGNVDTSVDSSQFIDVGFSHRGKIVSEQGAIIAKEFGANGASRDEFFLAFSTIGGKVSNLDDGSDRSANYRVSGAVGANKSDIVVRTFDAINQSFSVFTGVSSTSTVISLVTGKSVIGTFESLKKQLPSVSDFQAYMSSHQMAATQLAAAYCDAMVQDSTLRSEIFPDFDFTGNVSQHPLMSDEGTLGDEYWGSSIVDPLIDRVMNTQLLSASIRDGIRRQLVKLVTDSDDFYPYVFDGTNYVPDPDPDTHNKKDGLRYCENNSTCSDAKTLEVVKGVCTALLGSGASIIN